MTPPARIIRAEIMKVRTTRTWWLFLVGAAVVTAVSLVRNGASHHFELNPPLDRMSASDQARAVSAAAEAHTHAGSAAIAANMMTSGQFVGVLLAMLLGVLIATNEYHHHTATATFLANPHRGAVVLAKLAAAACFGALFWLVSTALDTVVTPIYLRSQHVQVALWHHVVVRSVLLGLLAFVLWAALGLGLGALLRSQVGSVVVGTAGYLVGAGAVVVVLELLYTVYPHAWVLGAGVVAPAIASMVMTTTGPAYEHAPPHWVGLLVMLGYVAVLGAAGLAATRHRDVT